MNKFYIEMCYLSGWGDAEWTEDDVPLRFDSVEDAQAALDEHLDACRDAVARGDMSDGHDASEYRVRPAP